MTRLVAANWTGRVRPTGLSDLRAARCTVTLGQAGIGYAMWLRVGDRMRLLPEEDWLRWTAIRRIEFRSVALLGCELRFVLTAGGRGQWELLLGRPHASVVARLAELGVEARQIPFAAW